MCMPTDCLNTRTHRGIKLHFLPDKVIIYLIVFGPPHGILDYYVLCIVTPFSQINTLVRKEVSQIKILNLRRSISVMLIF